MGGNFPSWARWLLGGAAVLAVALAGYFILSPPAPAPEPTAGIASVPAPEPGPGPEPAAEPAPESPPASSSEPTPAAEPTPEEAAPVAPEEPATPAAEPAPEPADALAPAFDVVRIRPDGDAVVAGRADPGAKVSVLVDGVSVADAPADAASNFVALFNLPPAETERVMTLEAVLADGSILRADQSVIIEGVRLPEIVAEAAPEPAAPASVTAPQTPATDGTPAAPATADTTPDAAPDAPVAAEPAPEASATAAPEPAPAEPPTAPQPAAPRVLLASPEGITVMQDPNPAPQLSIDTISYDDAGEVALAGRGQEADTLRIYLDNAPVRTAEIGPNGQWRAPLPDVATGVYTLRVDSIAPDGAVTSRVETPFKREEPDVLAAAEEKAAAAVAEGRRLSAITIQPGNTLWAIAEGRYGEGMLYVSIFEANRDQIRDPDWIYPGQVFTLPDAKPTDN